MVNKTPAAPGPEARGITEEATAGGPSPAATNPAAANRAATSPAATSPAATNPATSAPPAEDPSTHRETPAVLAENLTVVRGPRTVLHGLDFAVPRGRITGLLGPSGCGKSTLIRAIVGSQANVTGTLKVLDHPAGAPALRSRIGYVTQDPSVYDDLSVRQNLDYFAAVLDPGPGTAAERRHAHVTRVLDDVALTSHAGSLAGNLSGGQRSRVSLAVALLGTPELLVLDEPTVGLDPVLRRDLWNLFHTIATDRGATLLVSSHVMDEAERCHRLLLMREGELLADDTPDALRTRTHSETVEAAFLHLVDKAEAETTPATTPEAPATPAPARTTGTDRPAPPRSPR
ncbi:ABC transporter ATP-binding protein [Streptomyces sp. NPDC058284]|uniref:ABC transporter ATP-binding protein n=1 Tax=unclassified Streptomyces TaxID=2593676 RepID=UPI0036632BAA